MSSGSVGLINEETIVEADEVLPIDIKATGQVKFGRPTKFKVTLFFEIVQGEEEDYNDLEIKFNNLKCRIGDKFTRHTMTHIKVGETILVDGKNITLFGLAAKLKQPFAIGGQANMVNEEQEEDENE